MKNYDEHGNYVEVSHSDPLMIAILNRAIENGYLHNVNTEQDYSELFKTDRFVRHFFNQDGYVDYGTYKTTLHEYRMEKMKQYEYPECYLEQFLD